MPKEMTREELKKENDALRLIIKSLSETQSRVVDSSINTVRQHNKVVTRYQAKLNRFDREFAKKVQVCLLLVLVANTILLALRWL